MLKGKKQELDNPNESLSVWITATNKVDLLDSNPIALDGSSMNLFGFYTL